MTNLPIIDVTIIGGGPVGMFSAFYGGMRKMSVKIIESLPQLGGQLSALYPEKYIYDIAGFPEVKAQQLIDNLEKQMKVFPVEVCLEESVEKIEKNADGIFVITTNKKTHYSKTILITAGNGAFNPRPLGIEREDDFKNANLHYFVNDLEKFRGKNVMVFGGGDSAVDWALMLEPVASKVMLVHRRDKFRAHEHSVEKLMASSVEVLTPYNPHMLIGTEKIDQVILKHAKDESQTLLKDVDEVIVNYGFVSTLGPIKNWGLQIEKNSIVVNSRMETNIEGIYAAGDICTYEGKIKLIASGFGEAPAAISNAKVYVDPSSKVQPLHSTSIMENKKQLV
ncbi:NAD(P)/FAD-dependent oxidoreductase [Lysinibacillus sp. BW-2-10]|uniref:NAD(P)/FAD-dependent oxidoreductase n=1 Tax=Lysinibacillus sp. BW-2-10 TaxID=2590030 RepID=UPI00117FAB75|nr:NAD(P)/FAD-dependent oxidoreductase [Lysinibacillus sp. BW-2-10]TSI04538.1 NAD(P)/FAD-dependent oxidoreductase [Lysinibacillus sp. BW-2-10]